MDPGYYQVIYSLDFEFTSSSEEVELTTCVMSPSNPDVSTEFSEHPYNIVKNTYKGSGTVMVSFIFEAQKKTWFCLVIRTPEGSDVSTIKLKTTGLNYININQSILK